MACSLPPLNPPKRKAKGSSDYYHYFLRSFVVKLRKHLSRMHTARLVTVRASVSVATTRYRSGGGLISDVQGDGGGGLG